MEKPTLKIGLFGIGLDTYWPQFESLLPRLEEYQLKIKQRIESFGVTVADAGMVDNPKKAQTAAVFLRKEQVDIVFLFRRII